MSTKPSWEMNSFFEAFIPDARLAVSICYVSLSLSLPLLSLSLFFLCPSLTLSLTFPLEFLWEKRKFVLLPLDSKINYTIPRWGKPKT
jgi:hypothetical protein